MRMKERLLSAKFLPFTSFTVTRDSELFSFSESAMVYDAPKNVERLVARLDPKQLRTTPPDSVSFEHRRHTAAGRSTLGSVYLHQLHVPRTITCYGDRSFLVSGPAVWNSRPVELRSPDKSLYIFTNKLTTFLFRTVY